MQFCVSFELDWVSAFYCWAESRRLPTVGWSVGWTSGWLVLRFFPIPSLLLSSTRKMIKPLVSRTNDAGTQYRCGRVGRGSQPPSTLKASPNPPSNTDTDKKLLKRSFSHFSLHGRTNGRTDQRTYKGSYGVACLPPII